MSDPETIGVAFTQFTHFGGFDWAQREHQLVVVDPQGKIVLSLRFANDAEGWASFRQEIAAFPKLGIAIETNCGPAVERLLDVGLTIYPLNPKSAQRYRDRKAPAGAKDDALDAWSFGDALRTDGHGWRPLLAQDPLTLELRLLCRDEIKLIEQRTALVLQLRAALLEYYSTALVLSTTGPAKVPGDSSFNSQHRSFWPKPADASGNASCIPTSSIARRPPRSDWRALPMP